LTALRHFTRGSVNIAARADHHLSTFGLVARARVVYEKDAAGLRPQPRK